MRLNSGFVFLMLALSVFGGLYAVDTLKFAHVYEIEHSFNKGALMAAEDIERRTNGRVVVKVYPASQLGKESAINEGLSLGTVDIIYTGAGFAGSTYGPIAITDFPFTLRGLEHWKNYRDSQLFKEISDGYSKATKGRVYVAALTYYGTRHLTSNKPIVTPADMKGLKVRVPNAPAYVLFPKEVGANPTPMAFSEVYLALQQHVVDAQENPLPAIKAKKLYEVQSNINLTGHIINSNVTLISTRALNKLNDMDREVVLDELKRSSDWITEQVVESEKDLIDWFKEEGTQVNQVDRKPFIEVVTPALTRDDMPFSVSTYNELQQIKGNES